MNDEDSLSIRKIDSPEAIQGLGRHSDGGNKQKHEQQRPPLKKEVREYVPTISKAVESSNDILVKKGLPYRFKVYLENNEVFIDMVVLDQQGKTVETKRRNVSHQDFDRLIEDISNIEGLFFDSMA